MILIRILINKTELSWMYFYEKVKNIDFIEKGMKLLQNDYKNVITGFFIL